MMTSIIAAVIVFGILIFVHELGHFFLAKKFGIGVLKFSLGFGPRLLGRKIGETEYIISAFPLGGYVKLLGEDPGETLPPEDLPRSFSAQPVWKRLIVVGAGPLFNLLLAVLIFSVVFMVGIPVLVSEIGEVASDSPAMVAGLKTGDKVVAIDGKEIWRWEDMFNIVYHSAEKELNFSIEREGERFDVKIRPNLVEDTTILGEKIKRGQIGVRPKGTSILERSNPAKAVIMGIKRTWDISALTVVGIVKLIQRKLPLETIGGPIFIAQISGEQAAAGFLSLMLFVAILSVNLGVLNLLPIPILDGGHIFFFLCEAIIGRPVSIKHREIAQQIGLVILISLMVFAFYNDLMRIFVK